jgi:hypothetical protein
MPPWHCCGLGLVKPGSAMRGSTRSPLARSRARDRGGSTRVATIRGFDHYGIDRALWFGLPGLAKWSRNGMARGASDLVPEGTVGNGSEQWS